MKERKRNKKFVDSTAIYKPNSFKKELEDHLNVSLSSQSKIGRFLDPSTRFNFEYPVVGKFKSVMNLIYWLRSESFDDRLRNTARRETVDIFRKGQSRRIENFRAITLYALWIKIQNNPEIKKEISELPDDFKILSYTQCSKTGLRETTVYASHIVPIIEEIIRSLKNDRLPNFNNFKTVKGSIETGFIQEEILNIFKNNLSLE